MNKPNILYIHSHDTGRFIQPYGHAVPTPNLQQLAEDGVMFRQCFCTNPTCSPSRASLLCGDYPHQNGMMGLAHRGFALNDYKKHLLHTLRKEGYQSVLAGIQHIAHETETQEPWEIIGYDRYLGHYSEAHDRAVEFLDSKPEAPFFLSIGAFETHREFPAEDRRLADDRYCMPPPLIPDSPQTRRDMSRYLISAQSLDEKTGRILDALKRNGLEKNTLVICTTDHGLAFPNMKCRLTDSGTGVMLLMRGPGGFEGGKVIDAMISHLDVFPTICDLLEIDHPEWLEGRSVLPLVRGEQSELHEELFGEVNFHAAAEPMRSVRTTRWKYIRRYDNRNTPVSPNCDDGETKRFLCDAADWRQSTVDEEALYDLLLDPQEKVNRIADPALSDTLKMLLSKLEKWMERTSDPLRAGSIEPPAGARLDDADRT